MDSIALTYSLLDPIMTVLRPVTAFITSFVAGIVENFSSSSYRDGLNPPPDRTCLVDGCCEGTDCDPANHARHHTITEKLWAGCCYAFDELLGDLALWFLLGILSAGLISALVPAHLVQTSLGSGVLSYLGMLVVSLPMYVCASMSTPIAAALVMKGMSPGAALVLLMAGPATNTATIAMVGGLLGKRTLAIYLGSIVVCTLIMAAATDLLYHVLGLSAKATAGASAGELLPYWFEYLAAAVLAVLIVKVCWKKAAVYVHDRYQDRTCTSEPATETGCTCDQSPSGGT